MATDSFGNRCLNSRKFESFMGINSDSDIVPKTALRVNDATISSNKLTVSAESVSFSAGAAGTTGVVTLDKAPVYNVDGGFIGTLGDTSLAWITGTILTTEVKYDEKLTDAVQLAAMSNGEYAVNYDLGRIRYKKATTGTSDTCNYTSRQMNVVITAGEEVNIGAVEIKDATADTRASVIAVNSAAVGYWLGTMPARYMATPPTLTDTFASPLMLGSKNQLMTNIYDGTSTLALLTGTVKTIPITPHDGTTAASVLPLTSATASTGLLSVAGEIVDFDTSAGDDPTPVIGILGSSSGGAKALYLVSDDSAMDATPTSLPVCGEYRNVETTYADGDATVLQTTINGRLKVRAEGYDTSTDSMKSFEVSPLDQHYVEESLVDTTNLAAAANYYPSSTGALVGAYKDFSFTGKIIEDGADTITILVQGMNDEDTASGDWITIYGYRDDANSTNASVAVTGGTQTFAWSFNNFNFKYYRVVITPTSATNTAIVKLRKKAL